MNTVPMEIVEHIISFVCDRRGYNIFNYRQRVKDNEQRMKRIRLELLHWSKCSFEYNNRISVSWLKPTRTQRMQSKKIQRKFKKR